MEYTQSKLYEGPKVLTDKDISGLEREMEKIKEKYAFWQKEEYVTSRPDCGGCIHSGCSGCA